MSHRGKAKRNGSKHKKLPLEVKLSYSCIFLHYNWTNTYLNIKNKIIVKVLQKCTHGLTLPDVPYFSNALNLGAAGNSVHALLSGSSHL